MLQTEQVVGMVKATHAAQAVTLNSSHCKQAVKTWEKEIAHRLLLLCATLPLLHGRCGCPLALPPRSLSFLFPFIVVFLLSVRVVIIVV